MAGPAEKLELEKIAENSFFQEELLRRGRNNPVKAMASKKRLAEKSE